MTDPKLTVIMPAHNAETTIAGAIRSILCQSYPDFELWVLEGGSQDRTAEVARSFTDSRVKVFDTGSKSFQEVLAYALETAQTEWLARMDADDLAFPERFREQVQAINEQPDLVLVGTRCAFLTPFGHIFENRPNVVSREVGPLSLRLPGDKARFFPDATVMFKRSAALDAGGYDAEFTMGDVPLWFRILRRGRGWEIAAPLYLRRLHRSSMINTKIGPTNEGYRILAKYAAELVPVYYPKGYTWTPRPSTWYAQRYWLRIAAYEALTGDRATLRKSLEYLEQGESFRKEARLIRWFTYTGGPGSTFYRWLRRNKYRYRPDLEKLFTELFGPLPFAEGLALAGKHS